MRSKLIFFYIIITATFTSCDYLDDRLIINNLSKNDIAIEAYLDSLPDINLTNKSEYYLTEIISAGQKKNIPKFGSPNAWPFFVEESKNKKLNLFVFKADSLKKFDIDTIIQHKNYERYMFSEEELNKMNWTIQIK